MDSHSHPQRESCSDQMSSEWHPHCGQGNICATQDNDVAVEVINEAQGVHDLIHRMRKLIDGKMVCVHLWMLVWYGIID